MKIVYRVSPYLSSNPNPLGTDKSYIIKHCFNSFKKCLGNRKLIVISDAVNLGSGEVILAKSGNVETFHQQLDYVCNLPNEEKVMLVEDDYEWKENALDRIEEALNEFEIVTPYDHPGHYTEARFRDQPKLMRLIGSQIWREAPSTPLTFGCRAYVIKQNIDLIKSFGIRDHEMFVTLGELGLKVYAPIPSLATHLVTGLLAPGWLEKG